MTTQAVYRRRRIMVAALGLAFVILIALALRSCGDDDANTTVATEAAATPTVDPLLAPQPEPTTPAPEAEPAPDEVIAQVQTDLTELGFYTGPISGVNDAATEAALREFQASAGLDADGIYGPATGAALDAALGRAPAPDTDEGAPDAITVTVDGESRTFNDGVNCVLGPDDSGTIAGTAADGTTVGIALAGTESRVVIDGPWGSYDAPFTSVSNDSRVMTIQAAPPDIQVLVVLSFCTTA